MTASVSRMRAFVPTQPATGVQVTRIRAFVPTYDTALTPPAAGGRRRQQVSVIT